MSDQFSKDEVFEFWNDASCGEELYLDGITHEDYERQAKKRYELEGKLILPFAEFDKSSGLKILEIGVGLGAEHKKFAENNADLYGIDLTSRSIIHTKRRLSYLGLKSNIEKGDAEKLEFPDNFFDKIFSWGVIHHSPDTRQCVNEIFRVLKKDGEAKIMIYHKWSMLGFMLYFRYAILGFKPWLTIDDVFNKYMESPGTKAYSINEVRQLFSEYSSLKIKTCLSHADLLSSSAGQRHGGLLIKMARILWPRTLIKKYFQFFGLFLLIDAKK